MKTRIRIRGFKFSRGSFTKTFNEAIDKEVRMAARAWLRAVMQEVPVYLGAARGSLIPLGQFLRVAVPISPNPNAKPRAGLGPEEGARQGRFEFKHLQKVVSFSFSTNVAHYIFNEYNEAPNPPFRLIHETPWHSFEKGIEAFESYLTENLQKNIPKITDYLLREDIYLKG